MPRGWINGAAWWYWPVIVLWERPRNWWRNRRMEEKDGIV